MDNVYIADWHTEDKKPGELTSNIEGENNNLTTQFNYGEGYIGL